MFENKNTAREDDIKALRTAGWPTQFRKERILEDAHRMCQPIPKPQIARSFRRDLYGGVSRANLDSAVS